MDHIINLQNLKGKRVSFMGFRLHCERMDCDSHGYCMCLQLGALISITDTQLLQEWCKRVWRRHKSFLCITSTIHYCVVIMSAMASEITRLTSVCSIGYSGAVHRKHQDSASLAFVRGIHRSPVNSPQKGPVTRKVFPFDDVIIFRLVVSALFAYILPCFRGRYNCKQLISIIVRNWGNKEYNLLV